MSAGRRARGWFVLLAGAGAMLTHSEAARAVEANGTAVVLEWSNVEGARSFQLQIARDEAFRDMVVDIERAKTTYQWSHVPVRRHYWRVRSVDADRRYGPWSPSKPIEPALKPPKPLRPKPGATISFEQGPPLVTVEFAPEALATMYRVVVAQDGHEGAPFFDQKIAADGKSGAARASFSVPSPGVYSWRVSALSAEGLETPAAPAERFVVALAAPKLLGPARLDVAAGAPVTLRWSGVRFASRYRLDVARDRDFHQPLVQRTLSETSYVYALKGEEACYWRVVADDRKGHRSPPSVVKQIIALGAVAASQPASAPVAASLPASMPAPLARAPLRGEVGAVVGFWHNLGAIATAAVVLEGHLHLPVLAGRLTAGASAGFFVAARRLVTPALGNVDAKAYVVPLALLAGFEQPLGAVRLHGQVGPALHVVASEVVIQDAPTKIAGAAAFGFAAVASAALPFGPGAFTAALRFHYAPAATAAARLHAGGLMLGLGYEVGL